MRENKTAHLIEATLQAESLETDTRVPGLLHGPSLTFSAATSHCTGELIPPSWILIVKQDIYNTKRANAIFCELKMQAQTFPYAL